jgi:hypothetical protein
LKRRQVGDRLGLERVVVVSIADVSDRSGAFRIAGVPAGIRGKTRAGTSGSDEILLRQAATWTG